jgi:hypothetical protein
MRTAASGVIHPEGALTLRSVLSAAVLTPERSTVNAAGCASVIRKPSPTRSHLPLGTRSAPTNLSALRVVETTAVSTPRSVNSGTTTSIVIGS